MDWSNIFDMCKPYKNITAFDVTEGMKTKNFTVNKMFHLADEFYRSMGESLIIVHLTIANKSIDKKR